MGEATVVIGYDGESVRDGTMNVRDLAPALVAFGELIQAANLALNGSDVRAVVNIRAFRPGSMETMLQLLVDPAMPGILRVGADARDLLNWVGLSADITGISLLELIRMLRGRRATPTPLPPPDGAPAAPSSYLPEPAPAPEAEMGAITVYVNGDVNAPINIHPSVLALYNDDRVKKSLEGVVEPVKRPGIDRFYAAPPEPAAPTVSVTKEEARFFEAVPMPEVVEEVVGPTLRPNAYEVIKAVLQGEAKWELADATGRKDVSIEDEEFLREVHDGIREFGSRHVLIVDEEVRVVRVRGKLAEQRTIKKVREVKKYDPPPKLF